MGTAGIIVATVILLLAAAGVWWLGQRDAARRRAVAFFDVGGPDADRYQRLVDAFAPVAAASGAWHVVAEGAIGTTYGRKVNAGAGALVDRAVVSRGLAGPPNLATNIAVPSLVSSRRGVYLLPDRVLVKDGRRYGGVLYRDLAVQVGATAFVESDMPPADARQIGTTWRYVNRDGGPDRRFKANRQLPVMQYAELSLRGPGGFRVEWQLSRCEAAHAFADGLRAMGDAARRRPAAA